MPEKGSLLSKIMRPVDRVLARMEQPSGKDLEWAGRVKSRNATEDDYTSFASRRSHEIYLAQSSSQLSRAAEIFRPEYPSQGNPFNLQPELDAIYSGNPEAMLPYMDARANRILAKSTKDNPQS